MTKKEVKDLKFFIKNALLIYNINIPLKDIIFIDYISHDDIEFGIKYTNLIDYVLFKDKKTGKLYECYWGSKYYNPKFNTFYLVK